MEHIFKWFKKKHTRKIDLKQVYKDRAGNIYYAYVDPRELPGPRLRVAEVAVVEAGMNIDAKTGMEMIDRQMEYWNKGQYAQAINISTELYKRFKMLAEEETLLKLATAYFVMNGEDETRYNKSDQELKLRAWADDEDARDFFIVEAVKLTGYYSTISPEDILTYLKENKSEVEKAAKYLQKLRSDDT